MSTNRIRVLYVVENTSFGGGERGFGQLSTGVSREQFQPFMAAYPGGKLEEAARKAGVGFFPVDMSRKVNFKAISQLSKIISQNNINIVHSMGSRADFFARLACRKMPSTAVICTVAMLIEGYDVGFPKKIIYKVADRYSARYATHYITVSKALKDLLVKEHGLSPDNISVIYNGVELDRYDPNLYSSKEARHSLGITDGYPIVGTIGRLVYQKGFPYFLEAAKHIYSKKKQVRFVIVGHGEEERNLKNMADSLGISHVCIFAGPRFDVPELLSCFDVFVLSSVLEGLPRIVIEAMAMERPIVATNINGVREEIRQGETGLLVSPADSKALADAILILLDDRAKAEDLGREARKDAEEMFNLRSTLVNVEILYKNVLNSTP